LISHYLRITRLTDITGIRDRLTTFGNYLVYNPLRPLLIPPLA
jgi:hypothetical protein